MERIALKSMALILILAMALPLLLTSCDLFRDSAAPTTTSSETEAIAKEEENIPEEEQTMKVGKIDASMLIKQDGKLLKTVAGKTIYLRGINAGGMGAMEGWMQVAFVKNTELTTKK